MAAEAISGLASTCGHSLKSRLLVITVASRWVRGLILAVYVAGVLAVYAPLGWGRLSEVLRIPCFAAGDRLRRGVRPGRHHRRRPSAWSACSAQRAGGRRKSADLLPAVIEYELSRSLGQDEGGEMKNPPDGCPAPKLRQRAQPSHPPHMRRLSHFSHCTWSAS